MIELLEGYGWENIKCKNHLMVSFKKEDKRLNYYFTRHTLTIQEKGKCLSEKIENIDQLERLLINKEL